MESLLKHYNIPFAGTPQLKGKKRLCDADTVLSELNKKRRRKSVQACDGSSSGRTQGA